MCGGAPLQHPNSVMATTRSTMRGPRDTDGDRPSSPRPPGERVRVVRRETRQTRLQGLPSRLPQRGRLAKDPPNGNQAFFPTGRPWRWETAATVATTGWLYQKVEKVSTAAALGAGCWATCAAVQISLPMLPGYLVRFLDPGPSLQPDTNWCAMPDLDGFHQ